MYKKNKHIKFLITTFALVLFTNNTNAQEVDAVDNKGTIIKVNNNRVFKQNTDLNPDSPVQGDIWLETNNTDNTVDTFGHTLVKIYDGISWIELVPKAARIFYPPSIVVDASGGNGSSGSYELYDLYKDEFSNAMVSSDPTNAPSIPTYNSDELYYYITKYDTNIFDNVQITNTGTLTYDVIGTPTDDNTIFNVVFVVK